MEIRTGARRRHILAYFYVWFGLIVIAAVLNALNVNWVLSHPVQGVVLVVVLTMLEGSAIEFLMMTVVSLIYAGIGGHKKTHIPRKYDHNLTLLINFNLLAHCEEDIENAYKHMYESFMTNLSPDISAVLLSVTGIPHLKRYEKVVRDNYRALIRKTLEEEGNFLLLNQPQHVNPFRLRYFWKNYSDMSNEKLRENLEGIANQVANEFMCIHRVSKVLKKCGQYQDLFLLSEGETKAFTYTDKALYSTLARPFDQPLFHESTDVSNIKYRQFDYSLIMDNDTICPPGTAQEMLAVAAAHPDRGIIQPSIKMNVKDTDTIYMHLEMWRQRLTEPLSRSMATLYGQWGFYGKGMINIRLYIKSMIGTRDRPLEIVPIDVLSHDTYEAAVLRPLYVDSLYFEEEPSYNYVTWHIRERRWNQGELILSRYFWPNIFGRPIDVLRKLFDKRNFIRTGIRTRVQFGLVSTHVAHSALRSMFMKPMMLGYVFLQMGVHLHRPFLPLAGVLFLVCVFPKFAITNWGNARFALLETIASILQYTPEAFVGTVRLCQALFATICKTCTENWTPQRVVEEDMRHSNPFASGIRHLWAYSVVALVCTVIFAVLTPEANLIFFMFTTVIIIPFFTGITSLNPNVQAIRTLDKPVERKPNAPPESIMEEGGPRFPMQWPNSGNDPPGGPFYTPPNDESLLHPSYLVYETEAVPIPNPISSVRHVQGAAPEDSLEPIHEGREPPVSYVAPRHVVLQGAAPPRNGGPSMAPYGDPGGEDPELGRASSPDAPWMFEQEQVIPVPGCKWRKLFKKKKTVHPGPMSLYPRLENGDATEASRAEVEIDETQGSGRWSRLPFRRSKELPQLQPVTPQEVAVQGTQNRENLQNIDTKGGKGRWRKLTRPWRLKDPEPHVSAAKQNSSLQKTESGGADAAGGIGRWKKLRRTKRPKSAEPRSAAPRSVAAQNEISGEESEDPDQVGGKGKWKKLPMAWTAGDSSPDPDLMPSARTQAPVQGPSEGHEDEEEVDQAGGTGTWRKLPPHRRPNQSRPFSATPRLAHRPSSTDGESEADTVGGKGEWRKLPQGTNLVSVNLDTEEDNEPDLEQMPGTINQVSVQSSSENQEETNQGGTGTWKKLPTHQRPKKSRALSASPRMAQRIVSTDDESEGDALGGKGKWKKLTHSKNAVSMRLDTAEDSQPDPGFEPGALPQGSVERQNEPDQAGGTATWRNLSPRRRPKQSRPLGSTPRLAHRLLSTDGESEADAVGGKEKWKKLTRGKDAVSVRLDQEEDSLSSEEQAINESETGRLNLVLKIKPPTSESVQGEHS